MPPKKKRYEIRPRWVDELDSSCLRTTVVEALVARDFAMEHGANGHKACKAALKSADKTLDQIAEGKVHGDDACRKAAVAVRKYNTAVECARPTARR